MEAREAIKELTARYAWHVAHAEVDEIVALFTVDGRFKSPSAKILGVEELRIFLRSHLRAGATIPMVHNHVITIDGSTASASCVMETPWSAEGAFCGYYRDSCRRERDQWRFVERDWHYFKQA
jgi:hypothetical protein